METLCILCCYCYQHDLHPQDRCDDNQTVATTSATLPKLKKKLENANNAIVSLKNSKQFEQFCEGIEIEQYDFISALENLCDEDDDLSNSNYRNLAICPECLCYIEQAVEEKVKMEVIEVQVRELQRQLLVMLNKLQDCVDSYHLRMRKINDTVHNSDISCLQSYINGRNRNEGTVIEEKLVNRSSRRGKHANILEDQGNHHTKRNSVFAFRDSINKAVKKMEFFRKDLKKRIGGVPIPPPTSCDKLHSQDLQGQHFDYDQSVLKEEVEDPPAPPSPDNLTALCEVEMELQVSEEEKDMDEYQPVVEGAASDSNFSEEEGHGSNFSDEEEFKPPTKKTPKKKKKKKKVKATTKTALKNSSYLKNVDTSTWSAFKQRFIIKLLRKLDNKKSSTKQDIDPTRNYPMTFDSTTGELEVGGVQVLLMDEPQTSSGFLRCSQCPHQTKPASNSTRDESASFPNMEKAMISHVLGHHLNVFRCSVCDKSLLSHWRYLEHMKGHQGKFVCDVCGRPCATKDALAYHRWRHMSPEEQQEALQNGVKDPRRYLEKGKQQPKNSRVCSTCGKGFQNPQHLRQHEQTHRTDRETVICPRCGKSMLKHSFEVYHKNHGCSAHDELQPNRVHCLECNVSFKNIQFMRRHMIRVHSKESLQRNYVCELCSKRFKEKGDLSVHMKIHAEEKRWQCSQGCGKEFSVQRYWRRHNLTCGKTGGRDNKLISQDQELLVPEAALHSVFSPITKSQI